jgi:hypothetical protein
MQEIQLFLGRIEGLFLVLSFLQDLRNNLARYDLFVLYFLKIDRAILSGGMHDAKFGVVPSLRQSPLLETIKIVIEGLLFYHLEWLELNKLSESVLVRLSLKHAAVFGVGRQSLIFFLKMQQSIGSILWELQRL